MSTKAISIRFLDFYKDQRAAYEEYENFPEHTHWASNVGKEFNASIKEH
jgi:hypothetical protein